MPLQPLHERQRYREATPELSRAPKPRREYGTVVSGLSEWNLSADERCGIRPDVMDALGIELGDTVRIRNRSNGVVNAFTAYYEVDPSYANEIRMVKSARDRFYLDTVEDPTPTSFSAEVIRQVSDPNITREAAARAEGENYETWDLEPRDDIIITAPHAGNVELYTDEMAYRCAHQIDASVWVAEGYSLDTDPRGTFKKWHITSSQLDGGAWPGLGLAEDVGGWEYAISMHGFTQPDIAVGGRVPIELRRQIAQAFNDNPAITANAIAVGPDGDDAGAYSGWWGDNPENFVNRLTDSGDGGIQLEFPTATRSDEWRAVTDTLSDVLATL